MKKETQYSEKYGRVLSSEEVAILEEEEPVVEEPVVEEPVVEEPVVEEPVVEEPVVEDDDEGDEDDIVVLE